MQRASLTLFTVAPVLPALHDAEIARAKEITSELRASISREARAAAALALAITGEVVPTTPVGPRYGSWA